MAVLTSNPASTQTPDAGLGGSAVTGITTTGHGSTTSSASVFVGIGSDSQFQRKSARWFSFPALGGQIVSIRLKMSWTSGGNTDADDGGDGNASSNVEFAIDYSVNGGGAWTNIVTAGCSSSGADADSFTNNNSADVGLSVTQDMTQVQVRDRMDASATATAGSIGAASANASVTATITSIRLEITTVDNRVIMIL